MSSASRGGQLTSPPTTWIGRDRDRETEREWKEGDTELKRGILEGVGAGRPPRGAPPRIQPAPTAAREAPERQSEAPEGGGAPGRPPPDAYRSAPGVDAGAPTARGRGDRTLARPGPLPGTRAARAIRRPRRPRDHRAGGARLAPPRRPLRRAGGLQDERGIQGRSPRARLQAPPEPQLTPMARSDSWFPLQVLRSLPPLGLCTRCALHRDTCPPVTPHQA